MLCTEVKTWTKTCVFLQATEWILTMEKLHHPLKSTTQLRPIAEWGAEPSVVLPFPSGGSALSH